MSLENDINAIVESLGLELYDTAIVNENDETIYRVNVIAKEVEDPKKKGISLDQCVELTHLISPLLDVTPPVSGEYRLEVGSPGIERKLTTLDHFKKSIGEKVKIQTIEKEKIDGTLERVEGDTLFIQTQDGIKEVDFYSVKKAKTYFEW
ncbi:FIG000325: clustered with transcription termination protein NusA [hydrothermal vent metagenome]|uniref:FIG000325: clustered with transcription termination protein NusA n=1 Tax=hydrothermal vent metagenome TaxID=652676 RepID=A0A1W1D335_9ZZZZ